MHETQIIQSYLSALKNSRDLLLGYYLSHPFYPGYDGPPKPNFNFQWEIFFRVIEDMRTQLKAHFNTPSLFTLRDKALSSLVKKDLIEHPIFTTFFGISLAISGFIPYDFTKKKSEVKTISKKIQTVFWSYSKEENKGITTTDIKFKLWKVVTAFKKALAEETNEEVNNK